MGQDTVSPGVVVHDCDFSICRWRLEDQGSRSSSTLSELRGQPGLHMILKKKGGGAKEMALLVLTAQEDLNWMLGTELACSHKSQMLEGSDRIWVTLVEQVSSRFSERP